jgi:pilus assembly protein Flp/PilA
MKTIRRFIADETGATAIEYGLIAAGIAIAIITAVKGVGTKLSSNFVAISAFIALRALPYGKTNGAALFIFGRVFFCGFR